MRHRKKGKILSRKKEVREALLKNLTSSFVIYEKIKTTKAKAKAMQPIVEKLIALGKNNTLYTRRRLESFLPEGLAVQKIIEELSPRYKSRKGGYTRIVNIGRREGDGAEIVQIELV
ncbi:MAG: 50S ribosomal protein L17 [Parcubacteria group bacterium CG_4_10_14_0_8_um_filter_35_7]|nr:MAG: 50S ribosomal protein L17 [Parcubacteria group bacterium CG23_combo_of_CG06-09_8_20_14_all_35_9]PIY78448.1 MAG: 50S ribosomal protein L17 [Parcubacteria group bacterium CG_4_10_14_0_8_um_filter_35_7]